MVSGDMPRSTLKMTLISGRRDGSRAIGSFCSSWPIV